MTALLVTHPLTQWNLRGARGVDRWSRGQYHAPLIDDMLPQRPVARSEVLLA